jgi:hypothetical protein
MLKRALVLICILAVSACANRGTSPSRPEPGFNPASLAKTDIDRVAEAHQRAIFVTLEELAEKLYRRNPRELKKSGQPSVEAGVARIFKTQHGWRLQELNGAHGTAAVQLAFREDYAGDRVLALVGGLGGMIQLAFNDKTEFYLLDSIEAQALYNAARNIEIAVWKLSTNRNSLGELYLLSNEGGGAIANLSFERQFGKMIATLDVLSHIMADKSHRTVVKVVQNLATAVFLPIPIR